MKPTITFLFACILGYYVQAVETSEPPQWVKDKVHKNWSGQVTGTRFITKYYLWKDKFAIASTDAVSDSDFDKAIEIVDLMIGHRDDILTQLLDMGHVMLLFNGDDSGPNEKVSDFGCYASTGADNYGYGGNPNSSGGTVSSLNIENFGWREGNGVYREDIFMHEFSHGIHLCGLNNTDFDSRLLAHFNAAGKALWVGTYADDDHKEYWAEISQSYFNANYAGIDPYHNGWDTQAELLANDPTGYNFCVEVYGEWDGGDGGSGTSIDMGFADNAYGGLRTIRPGDELSFWAWVSGGSEPSEYTLTAKNGNTELASNTLSPSNWDNGEWASPGTATLNNSMTLTMEVEYANDPESSNNTLTQEITAVAVPTTNVTISVTTGGDPTALEFGLYNKGDNTNDPGTIEASNFGAGDANKTIDFQASLTNGSCYAWKMFSSSGDGSVGTKMEIKDNSGNVIYTLDGTSESYFWGVGNFMVDISSGLEQNEFVQAINVFPNPAQEQATLSLELTESAEVSYQLQSLSGQVVLAKNMGTQQFGTHQIQLDVRNIPAGIYMLQTQVNGYTMNRKLQVQH